MTSTTAFANNDQVARGPVPDWVAPSEPLSVPADAAGALFVRYQDFIVRLDDRGASQYLGYRIRILHPNALQLGNIQIAWRPEAGPATVHFIRLHRDGEVTDVLAGNRFEILRREDRLEAASLDGMLTGILRVPDLRVGDELEVGLTITTNDPTLRETVAGSLFLLPEPSPGRFRLGLNWREGQEPRIQMTPDMAAAAQRQGRTINLSFDNPPLMMPPADAPPRYFWQRLLEYSDFGDWAAISARFAPLYREAAQLRADSPLRAEARRIAAAHPDPLARARAALALVQQQVRYVYVGLNDGNLTPASADETWQRRFGDCKGKTALLLALLAELGIAAEAVLVNNGGNDDGLDQRLPNPGMFDHVLVRATIDGTVYWLDGTLPVVAEPAIVPALPYRWVLPLGDAGHSLERLPWRPSTRPDDLTLHNIDARAGFDVPARITSTVITRGPAGLLQYQQLSGLTPAQLLNGIRQGSDGSTWQEIEDVRWRYDVRAGASIMTITGTGMVDWESGGGGVRQLSLPGGGFSPPARRVRPSGQDQTAPFYAAPEYSCHVTTVRVPATTQPGQWSFNDGFDTRLFGRHYFRAFDMRDGAIRMVRGTRIERTEISADEAAQDNGRIATFDNSMARITHRSLRFQTNAQASGSRVPTTDEIDWTADDVPCLGTPRGN